MSSVRQRLPAARSYPTLRSGVYSPAPLKPYAAAFRASPERSRRAAGWVTFALLALATLALLGAGCRRITGSFPSTGSYPADVFTEMHYTQSYRSQEPPRLASAGAVPITGVEQAYTAEQYAALTNPTPRTPENLTRGAELFRVNCSMCHGVQGKGNGPVGDALVASQYSRPPDLAALVTADKSDGQLYQLVSEGVFVMPRFKSLLSAEDRWLILHHVRRLQGK